ncbi:MAG: cobalamin-independent methionine synthase II family protein [Burkholderiales bacterium]|nr:cobalamin-independent methionine synthase II family protein [Burkholderiales bacterium]
MRRSTDHILTTHTGSLPRADAVLEGMRAREEETLADPAALEAAIDAEVAAIVARQVAAGIDVVNDGECGRPNFHHYVGERLSGFEKRVPPGGVPVLTRPLGIGGRDAAMFPDYYRAALANNPFANAIRMAPRVCVGPIGYVGQAIVARDIARLKSAMAASGASEGFMSAASPMSIARNEHYPSAEAFQLAFAEAMRVEYRAIIDAGLVLQIDDPRLFSEWDAQHDWDMAAYRRWAEERVEFLNHALRGLPEDRIRFHACYGVNCGPRVSDLQLETVIDLLFRINAGAYSFEAANPRHEHEWRVPQKVRLPAGKTLIPGVVTHSNPMVEHPETVAERIVRWAQSAGRENIVVGNDCGFASNAGNSEIPATVAWAKLRALGEGARLASAQLWR